MKNLSRVFYFLFLTSLLFTSCKKDIEGCTDPLSHNYNSEAVSDNGSCEYYYGGREMGQIDVGSEIDTDNEYDIYIDGDFIGRLTHYFPNGLSCGNPNSVGRIIESGSHIIRAEGNGGSVVREGYVELSPQDCLVVLLENLPLAGGGGGGIVYGSFTDPRDGQTYVTVKIGNQEWFAENLKINIGNQPPHPGFWFCYDDNPSNCSTYGKLYEYYGANLAIPSGWHLPSLDEWNTLISYLGENAGGKMKETGYEHWQEPNEGATNESGFTALPGGYRPGLDAYLGIGVRAIWWTSTEGQPSNTFKIVWLESSHSTLSSYFSTRQMCYSVRPIKD